MARPGLLRRAWSFLKTKALSPVGSQGGWYPLIKEPYTGAWQRGETWTVDTVLAHPTVYACVTLIAADIAKMRTKLVHDVGGDLWVEAASPAFSPVLRKPNHFQTQGQFKKAWIISKLTRGNTYVLQERDSRGIVVKQYVLSPDRVKPLVAPDGSVYYELKVDELSGVTEDAVVVPASEIIHDRSPTLFHPLVGISPLFAGGGPANIGLRVQSNSVAFFGNGSTPSGILTAPEAISAEDAKALKDHWEQAYSGTNTGKIAVLGSGLTFQPMRMSAVDSQLIEHLNWSDEAICRAFKVPPFMVGVGPVTANQNVEADTRKYLTTCLQEHVDDFESCMDDGLGLMSNKEGRRLGIELDTAALLQMDTATQFKTLSEGVRGGFLAPNEARRIVDLEPLTGGDTVYLQHQDYPIEALYDRTLNEPVAQQPPATQPPAEPDDDTDDDADARAIRLRRRNLRLRVAA